MNILKFELKALLKNAILWMGGIGFFLVFYMAFFPLMANEDMGMQTIMDSFPEEFLAFFGMNGDLPFTTLMGYYGLTMSFVMIPVAIQAAYYGFHILSVEERELTADFLLTKPVSRKTIYIQKVSATLITLSFTTIVILLMSFLSFALFNEGFDIYYKETFIYVLTIPLFQLFFVSIGLAVTTLTKKIGSVIAYSMGLGFGLFIIASFGEMLMSNFFKALSPYSYFEPISILASGSWNLAYTIVDISIILIAFSISYIFYLKRNIKSL